VELTRLTQSAYLLKPQRLFRLRQQGSNDLFRLILRRSRKIKRIQAVFQPAGSDSGPIAVATA
jgi:hypothetical protein